MAKNHWIKIPQAVELLEVSDKTVRERIKKKRYRIKRVRGKFGPEILILREDVEKDLQGSESPRSEAVSQVIPTQTAQSPGSSQDTLAEEKPDVRTPLAVLVADESEEVVKLVVGILQEEGISVLTASNGHEALEKIRTQKPALLIIEPALPLMDGFQLARAMEADTDMSHVPIAFCSFLKERAVITEALSYKNAVRYFTKPLLGKQLKELKRFIRSREWMVKEDKIG